MFHIPNAIFRKLTILKFNVNPDFDITSRYSFKSSTCSGHVSEWTAASSTYKSAKLFEGIKIISIALTKVLPLFISSSSACTNSKDPRCLANLVNHWSSRRTGIYQYPRLSICNGNVPGRSSLILLPRRSILEMGQLYSRNLHK